MLDIKIVREKPEIVLADIKKRGLKDLSIVVDDVLKLDNERREIISRIDNFRSERNIVTDEIAHMKSKGMNANAKIKKAKALSDKISDMEIQLKEVEEKLKQTLMKLPNILHESVPIGMSDEENVEVRRWGNLPKFDFEPKNHVDIIESLNLVDIERAAKIAGSRFYYLKGKLVILHQSILRFALDMMIKEGYIPIVPPYMMKRDVYEGVIDWDDFENVLYKTDNDDLYMIATAEHPMMAMHAHETLNASDLPLKYVAISPCFRTEAGAHGKDTKGIFRVHQFEKVEQAVFCKPEQSWELHEELIRNAEKIFQALEIPYRVVNVCTGDIGTMAAKKYDLEAWLPAQKKFREVVSCSNITDFQSRRLGIKWREGDGKPPAGYVHTLNSTAIASPRAVVAILENFQRKDGSVGIPKVLWPYTGFREISSEQML